jgi:hypothetical protein
MNDAITLAQLALTFACAFGALLAMLREAFEA